MTLTHDTDPPPDTLATIADRYGLPAPLVRHLLELGDDHRDYDAPLGPRVASFYMHVLESLGCQRVTT